MSSPVLWQRFPTSSVFPICPRACLPNWLYNSHELNFSLHWYTTTARKKFKVIADALCYTASAPTAHRTRPPAAPLLLRQTIVAWKSQRTPFQIVILLLHAWLFRRLLSHSRRLQIHYLATAPVQLSILWPLRSNRHIYHNMFSSFFLF
jgi:hypothetical protein